MSLSPVPGQPAHGALLRYWRRVRGKSQLALSLDSGVSQRHLSYLESGRSQPSRKMLLTLSQTLDIPLRERNELLLAAGFAPVYREDRWDAPEMAPVMRAVDRVLRQQEPYPALVMDRYWNVIRTNEAAPRFFGSFLDLATRKKPRNLLHLMLDPEGMRPFVERWEEVAAGLLQRVRREAVGRILDGRTTELLAQLRQYPGVAELGEVGVPESPVLPITFLRGGERISFFSLISTVGTPQWAAVEELRIECMFPAEEEPAPPLAKHVAG